MLPLEVSKSDRIAIVAPHPDDECIGVGGIIALFPAQCDVYVVSDGSHGSNIRSICDERKVRYQQFLLEMEYAKVNQYFWLGYEDGTLIYNPGCVEEIEFTKYDIVFIPFGHDNHPDHLAVYNYSLSRMKEKGCESIRVYQYEVHSPMHYCTHYIDISQVIEKKMKLVAFHMDQIETVPYDKMVKELAGYRAGQLGMRERACEAFYLIDLNAVEDSKEDIDREKNIAKYKELFRLFNQWVRILQVRKIEDYFQSRNIDSVSIYGYADLGKRLYEQLLCTPIKIVDIFDKRKMIIEETNETTKLPIHGDREVGIVVITTLGGQEEITKELQCVGYENIVTLQAILDNLMG